MKILIGHRISLWIVMGSQKVIGRIKHFESLVK